jgi:hypothetical protein
MCLYREIQKIAGGSVMSHPIKPFMPSVFMPVSDLKRSIDWYCELLELPVQPEQDGGGIYYFGLGGTDLILDSNVWGFPPTIMFDTSDIDAAREFCLNQQFSFMSEMFRYSEVAFFNVDSNMICQSKHQLTLNHRNPALALDHSRIAHPHLQRITRVIIHADQLSESEKWYETFLDKSVEPDPTIEGLNSIRMSHGAHLLIDDNRLCQTEKVRFDRLQLDLRVNPIVIFESPDLEASLLYVQSKGASIQAGIENRLGLSFFTFNDPDGNGLMVCQIPILKK